MIKKVAILKTKLMKTEELKPQHSMDLEPFYQALEDDLKLLEEALEILLGMVNFEPRSYKEVGAFYQRRLPQSI